MEQKIKQIMAELLGMEMENINMDTSPDNVPDWDSLKHMQLILTLEEEFEVEIPDDSIDQMLSYKAIVEVIKELINNK